MITECKWMDVEAVGEVRADDVLLLMPYKDSISIMTRSGTHLVYARHDGADESGDADALIMLCLYRFNKGEHDV